MNTFSVARGDKPPKVGDIVALGRRRYQVTEVITIEAWSMTVYHCVETSIFRKPTYGV